jgi:hypothetical protein
MLFKIEFFYKVAKRLLAKKTIVLTPYHDTSVPRRARAQWSQSWAPQRSHITILIFRSSTS